MQALPHSRAPKSYRSFYFNKNRKNYRPQASQRCVKCVEVLKRERELIMTGRDTCVVCGNTLGSDPKAYFHCFTSDPERRARLLRAFAMEDQQL